MSGVDHYRQAEKLLTAGRPGETAPDKASRLAEAQVAASADVQEAEEDDRDCDHEGGEGQTSGM
jgi:hypothetical protein